jgi:uroporphyrin-III C-methyltransferase
MLVTGHAGDASRDLHWPTLAAAAAQGLTLVVYMGVLRLADIQAGLLRTLPPTTPAALVQNASTAHERRLVTTLARLATDAHSAAIASPAILIVGDVLKACEAAACASVLPRPEHGPAAQVGAV